MTTYRISAVAISNFKRLKTVELTPDADAAIFLLSGKNAQGKSSIIDAIEVALRGARSAPTDPIRHGTKSADIEIELASGDGSLTVSRVFNGKGSQLEVRSADGTPMKSPQAMLDKLFGGFLDPLTFIAMPAKEQRAQLMKLIKDADRIDGLNEKRLSAFTRRTELGRDLTKAKGELERLVEQPVPPPIDVASLTAEVKELSKLQMIGVDLNRAHNTCESVVDTERRRATENEREVVKLRAEIAEMQKRIDERQQNQVALLETLASAEAEERVALAKVKEAAAAWVATAPRRTELDAQLAGADAHNRASFAAEANNKRRTEAAATVAQLDASYNELTDRIAEIDTRKAAILGAAKLPVDGLKVTDDGVEFNGVPFAQASGAEKLRIGLALAAAASPNLDDVWIRDGALLDEDSLAAVAAFCTAAKKRAWVERVGTGDPGCIVIADGQVAS